MRHAALLAFPSHGPESLSRVLIEASALGLPIAAMEGGELRRLASSELGDGQLKTLLARGSNRRTPHLHPRAMTAREAQALGNRTLH